MTPELPEAEAPPVTPRQLGALTERLMWILWPSFLLAGVAEMIVFSLFDPADLQVFGVSHFSRTGVYTIGFFVFWALTAGSSALTLWLAREPRPAD